MSLFGAMFSGVSGLTAQSSALGAVSDNITNVSTVGYKATDVNFQSLVTKQVSSTFYSAGGVQSRPRQRTEVQGLLQASTSQTDMAISGQGFFVVNEASRPTITDQYLYTRSGSFIMDNEGFLKNTSGLYLQGWPTDARGNVIATDPVANPIPNQNIISTDFLEAVNLSRVGGTAAATTAIAIGANLPSNADPYNPVLNEEQDGFKKTDVQFFDTLGNANNVSVTYRRSPRANQWDISVEPPSGASVLTLFDGSPLNPRVYESQGLLEFTSRPVDGAQVVVNGVTYEFDDDASVSGTNTAVDISTTSSLAQDVQALQNKIIATDNNFTTANARVSISQNSSTTLLFREDGTGAIAIDPAGMLNAAGNPTTKQTAAYTVQKQDAAYTDYSQFTFTGIPANGNTIQINGTTYSFVDGAPGANQIQRDGGATIETIVNDLAALVAANDPEFTTGSVFARNAGGGATNDTLVIHSLAGGSFDVVLGLTGAIVEEPDGTGITTGSTVAVNTEYGLQFDSDGVPLTFNVADMEITGFASGAADMDDDVANSARIALDFGSAGEANGMTQFGSEFTPAFIQQNGSRFGTFAGVSITTDGLVTALFNNGETRTIYKLPIATFVNTNALEARTGNSWNATEASGDFTLRAADSGPAGQVVQGALEASTVDIGEEFTKMIVVQRAYSASTKVIRTADEMLEELTRLK